MSGIEEEQPIGAYCLVRCGADYVLRLKNSIIRNKSIAESYTCKIIGTAIHIDLIEDGCSDEDWSKEMRRKGMLVLGFRSEKYARMCIEHTHEFNQHDWVEGVDILFLPLQKCQTLKQCRSKPVFQVVDMVVYDHHAFQQAVEGEMPSIDAANPDCEGAVVVAQNKQPFRGMWDTHLFVIHEWESKCAFDTFYDSNKYKSWREKRHELTKTYMYTFCLDPPAW